MSTTTVAGPARPLTLGLPPLALVLGASALAWVILFAAIPPARQDFPLNDDWAFGRGALLFARGEGVHYGGWASMPQLGQWLWACPFVWLLGPSFVALRLSTIALAWLGLWAFYDLLRQDGWAPAPAALAAATLALNPLFFLLQGTFMTDVPALSLSLAALALYARGLRAGGGGWWLAAGCVVAALAAVTRQNTLAVPAAAALLLACRPGLRRRPTCWLAVLLPAAAGVATHLWFQARPDVRALAPALAPPAVLLALPFVAVHLLGLCALPLLAAGPWQGPWRGFARGVVLMALFAGYWLLYGAYLPYGSLFPYSENMLTPWGAFAGSRSSGLLTVGERPLLLATPARVLLTLLGCAAGAALVVRAVRSWRAGAGARPLVLFTLLQVPFLLIAPVVYDRYWLFLLPGALCLAAGPRREAGDLKPLWLPALTAALLGLVSVGLMHDWLSWNAARWALGRRAVVVRHIAPRDIEGGFEWDASFAPAGEGPPRAGRRPWPVLPFTEGWFPAITGRYALSFSPLKGARGVDSEPYALWLLPGRRAFFLLEWPNPAAEHAQAPAH